MIIQSTPIEEIINAAVTANKLAANNKNIQLSISIDPSVSTVSADKDKTSWVLINLVSNAIRYSHENATVHIEVRAENDKIKFSVMDTGQGIEPKYIHKIFDRYFRIPSSKKEGTGLGLSISKEFIEAQGGEITVISDLGKGSAFSFTLNAG
ncbi:sensor histidine kinase, partial [Sediminibacterium sp.]